LGKLLGTHYQQDAAEFEELLPNVYNAAFWPDYEARMAAADKVVSARLGQGQSAALGARIVETGAALPGLLNRLEARAKTASGLTVPVKMLGIQAARTAYRLADWERLDTALKLLLQNLADNAAALAPTGHTAAETTKLRTLHEQMMADSAAQDASQTGTQRLTAANMATLNHLYALMARVLADGKSLYKGVNKAKLKGYTLRELLKRVRTIKGE
jgi:hypothetical protein